jgi:DNA-binding NarL/FixJ family response regulator
MKFNAVDFSSVTDWNQTNEAIAKQLNCCDKTVRNARRARGLPRAPDKTIRTELKEKLPQINDKAWRTHSNEAIASILKCSKSAVRVFRTLNSKPQYERKR